MTSAYNKWCQHFLYFQPTLDRLLDNFIRLCRYFSLFSIYAIIHWFEKWLVVFVTISLFFFFSVLESIKRLYPFLLRNFSIIFFSLNPSLKCSSKFSRYKHFCFISEIRNLLCYVPLQDYHMCSWSPNNNERTYLGFLSSQKQRIVTMQIA